MKNCINELIIIVIQLLVFYMLPLFVGSESAIGMVLLILLITFILSIITGIFIKRKIKYLYPILVSLLFIPSIFIYYNESALIHSIWYLVVSLVGLVVGVVIRKLFTDL